MKAKPRSRARLHVLVSIAPWVPTDGRPVAISAYCPKPKCGIRYVWRRADHLAERLANWPPKDAATVRRLGKPVVAEYEPGPLRARKAINGRSVVGEPDGSPTIPEVDSFDSDLPDRADSIIYCLTSP